mmetsp:Transcript_6134/g.10030  ORF Transcript_6134/g.10030 Transcript_6134/m.10030 type:complete len:329 (+) Transcript_6134:146-1132(+)
MVQKKQKQKNEIGVDFSNRKPTLISYICVCLGLGWFVVLPINMVILFYLYQYSATLITVGCGVILVSTFYTVDRDYQPAMCFKIGDWIMGHAVDYFSFKIEFEDMKAVEEAGPSIFAVEPHGVLPISIFWGTVPVLKQHKLLACMSSSIFLMPMMKHFLTWCGATSVDKMVMKKYLKRGFSLNLCPGGVQEIQYLSNTSKEMVFFLKKRVGLTKLALQEGVCLVPSVTFGLENIYSFWKFENDMLMPLARKIGFYPMMFFGLGGVPFAQAKPSPITVIVGKPLKMPQISDPTAEDLEKYHKAFIEAISELFENNKHENGMGDLTLRIV